ncbi:hypothetical protein F2Q69_00060374 [Brassica cretica]|uniref:t-SNARE coiled-coil homology domain-containing protein n=1 Tax=Brassica cretica TaxID=69181 RepID=A0A8S9RK47_BRACR|nr:hypothetical protein F2Q69_00060374 [Brassica cretica]
MTVTIKLLQPSSIPYQDSPYHTLSFRLCPNQWWPGFILLRENIQQEYREVVERRIYTVTGERAGEDTIVELIETGNTEQIFQKAIQEQGRGHVMDTLWWKSKNVMMLSETWKRNFLTYNKYIFLDMAVLVDTQGEMLDNIESHITCDQETRLVSQSSSYSLFLQ